MSPTLPAGLMPDDSRVELWTILENTDQAFYLTLGRAGRVKHAPKDIKAIIRQSLEAHPLKRQALVNNGYAGDDEQLEKYTSCITGAFDGEADIVNGQLILTEYWPCPVRKTCPMAGIVCNPLVVGPDNEVLTSREIDHLVLISTGLYNKEIADRLEISEETVKVHHKHIYKKTRLNNKPELTLLAKQKNLI